MNLTTPFKPHSGHAKVHIDIAEAEPLCGTKDMWRFNPWTRHKGTLNEVTCKSCRRIYERN